MKLTVTHLEYADWGGNTGRWAVRFFGPEQDFNMIRQRFKALGRPAIAWSPAYQWKSGKPGAWLITGRQLDTVRSEFENLEGTHTSKHERTSIVHECAFWITGTPGAKTPHRELEPA
jgi:hypothetical protein